MAKKYFDFSLFRANLKATKPPYKCPIKNCEKVYRSLTGMQQHFDDHEDRLQKSNRKKGRPRNVNSLREKTNKQIVKVELGGQLIQFDASKPMKLVTTENGRKPACTTIFKASKTSSQRNHEASDVGESTLSSTLPEPKFKILDTYVRRPAHKQTCSSDSNSTDPVDDAVLYDADEEDMAWLELLNEERMKSGLQVLQKEMFENIIDKMERFCHFERRHDDRSGSSAPTTRDEDAICSVCLDGECLNTNVILFCDLCDLAVHQECYGVPHIPDGPWICRRCLLSPSKVVDCCLCPSKIGAMKQTDNGKWAHIVCALWIPDAGFANSVFLEPIDGIERISPARWKLTCQVCRRKSAGACIQCHNSSCYTAFHVTCAQQAGLHMEIESSNPSRSDGHAHCQGTSNQTTHPEHLAKFSVAQSNWSKTVYCDFHTPSQLDEQTEGNNKQSCNNEGGFSRKKATPTKATIRQARKLVAEGKEVLPLLSFPGLDNKSFDLIKDSLQLADRNQVIERLKNYWLLKRRSRNGVPVVTHPDSYCLKKMEGSMGEQRVNICTSDDDGDDNDEEDNEDKSEVNSELEERRSELKMMKKLRHELESVRLLNELIKKRERTKIKMFQQEELLLCYKLNPVQTLFDNIKSESDKKGLAFLMNDDEENNDDISYTDDCVASDADFSDDLTPSKLQKMSEVERKVAAMEYDTVTDFEVDFKGFCDSRRMKVKPRWREKMTAIKKMGLRLIRRYTTAVASLAISADDNARTEKTKRVKEIINDEEGIGVTCCQVAEPDVDIIDVKLPKKESYDSHASIPDCFSSLSVVPPLTSNDSVPCFPNKVVATSLPLATASSATTTSSPSRAQVRSALLMRPPKKRRQHGFESGDNPSKSLDASVSDRGLDENDNLRLLAEAADSISSENSYSVDNSSLPTIASSKSPEDADQSRHDAVPPSNLPQSSTQDDNKSHAFTTTSLNNSQSKTIEACDSTTDWPSSAELRSKRKSVNQNHQMGKNKCIGSSKNSLKRNTTQSEDSEDINDDELMETKKKKIISEAIKEESTGTSNRRETRRRSSDSKDLEDFFIPLNHGDFVWAQYAKFPSYPAIMVCPSHLNGIVRGRSTRGKEGLVGVDKNDIIPIPTLDVINANSDKDKYLVCFFDQKRTWTWVQRSKLDPLGVDSGLDKKKMFEVKRLNTRKPIIEAYKRALCQRCLRYRENYSRSLAAVLDQ